MNKKLFITLALVALATITQSYAGQSGSRRKSYIPVTQAAKEETNPPVASVVLPLLRFTSFCKVATCIFNDKAQEIIDALKTIKQEELASIYAWAIGYSTSVSLKAVQAPADSLSLVQNFDGSENQHLKIVAANAITRSEDGLYSIFSIADIISFQRATQVFIDR